MYTSGPWEISKIGNNYDQYGIFAGNDHLVNTIEGKDNANLISAAPELLEALKELVEWQLFVGGEATERNSQVIAAREAIAKAEGRNGNA